MVLRYAAPLASVACSRCISFIVFLAANHSSIGDKIISSGAMIVKIIPFSFDDISKSRLLPGSSGWTATQAQAKIVERQLQTIARVVLIVILPRVLREADGSAVNIQGIFEARFTAIRSGFIPGFENQSRYHRGMKLENIDSEAADA